MALATVEARDAARRRAIIEAARHCFLKFGYGKTSLDDIAKQANLSRPLIYRKFKNKEEVFAAVYEHVFATRYPAAEAVLTGTGTRRDKLLRVYEILLIEPWVEVSGAPMSAEFYDACARLLPKVQAKYERLRLKCTQEILGSREVAEVFMLAVDGLESDLPTPPVLRRRLQLLVDRFA
jgi:AcrR family transcriptional regulator